MPDTAVASPETEFPETSHSAPPADETSAIEAPNTEASDDAAGDALGEGGTGRAKPWTQAMSSFLASGEWLPYEDVVKVGMAAVDDDRASHEMRARPIGSADDAEAPEVLARRLEAGRRTVAGQSLMGMRRFGKVEFSKDKKTVRAVGQGSQSLGDLALRVKALEDRVEELTRMLGEVVTSAGLAPEATGAEVRGEPSGETYLDDDGIERQNVLAELPGGGTIAIAARV